jgi:hypothetical protein
MGDEPGITRVESAAARCAGTAEAPHRPVDLVLPGDATRTCPVCGRRFRRGPPPDIVAAAWPAEDD